MSQFLLLIVLMTSNQKNIVCPVFLSPVFLFLSVSLLILSLLVFGSFISRGKTLLSKRTKEKKRTKKLKKKEHRGKKKGFVLISLELKLKTFFCLQQEFDTLFFVDKHCPVFFA